MEGFAPSLPDIPIYIYRDESYAQQQYPKGYRRWRVTVVVEDITEDPC